MTDKAGWEVEGFIDRLTRRSDSNSERLVLEAISHLRAFSRDCDALRESNREAADEIERLNGRVAELELTGDRKALQAMLDQLGLDFERMRERAIRAESDK